MTIHGTIDGTTYRLCNKVGYLRFIKGIREYVRDGRKSTHSLPVLPPKPAVYTANSYFDIDLELRGEPGGDAFIHIRLRKHDLYLIGYKRHNVDPWFEFKKERGNDQVEPEHEINGSQFLPFGGSYQDMEVDLNNPRFGRLGLVSSIRTLGQLNYADGQQKRSLLVLVVMICEATRFDKILNHLADYMIGESSDDLKVWMKQIIHDWEKLCKALWEEDMTGAPVYFDKEQDSTATLGEIKCTSDTVNCLGIVLPYNPTWGF